MVKLSSTMLLLQLLRFGGFLLWATLSVCTGDQDLLFNIFKRHTVCHVEERLQQSCAHEELRPRSLMDCLRMCSKEDLCVGASLNETSETCVLHQVCSPSVECSPGDIRHDYWENYCVHGHWDIATRSCQCLYKTFGDRCDQYLQDCPAGLDGDPVLIDLQEEGSPTEPMMVCCYQHFIVAAMNSGKAIFNRTYQEYVRGFWADRRNFWTGLKHLNRLQTIGYTRFNIWVTLDDSHSGYWLIYNDFLVRDEAGNYSLSGVYVNHGISGTAPPGYLGDCLGPAQGTAFSTWDNDKDGSAEENCASIAGSGWWYSGCDNPCNLLGWGLDDWDGTPPRQRLSAIGVDIKSVAPRMYGGTLLLDKH